MADHPEFVVTLSHGKNSPKQVTLAFSMGLKSISEGHSTAILLLLDAVFVGTKGYVDEIDIGAPFLPVKEMLDLFVTQGGQLLACANCWTYDKVPDGQRIPGCVLVSAEQVVELLLHAKGNLQVN